MEFFWIVLGCILAQPALALTTVQDSGSQVRVEISGGDAQKLFDALPETANPKVTEYVTRDNKVSLVCNKREASSCTVELTVRNEAPVRVVRSHDRVGQFEVPIIDVQMIGIDEAKTLFQSLRLPRQAVPVSSVRKRFMTRDEKFWIDCNQTGSIAYCGMRVLLEDLH